MQTLLLVLVSALLLAAAPAWPMEQGPLIAFVSPIDARVDVATNPACAIHGVCDGNTGICSSGLVGTTCQTASDCVPRLNTCRFVLETIAPEVAVSATLDGKPFDVLVPRAAGQGMTLEVPLQSGRKRSKLKIVATATVDGRVVRQRNVFRFTPIPHIRYRPMPAKFGVPGDQARLLELVANADTRAIREHAWAIWAGLTARTPERFNRKRLPVFETWFSGSELYDAHPYACEAADARPYARKFEKPSQHVSHGGGLPNEQVTGFNRFNRPTTEHVCANQYNLAATLDTLNATFTPATPIADRQIVDFPNAAMALKPVFTPIAGSGITILPYWNGPTASTNLVNPTPDTWTQCVAVVPPGTAKPDSPTPCSCNGIPTSCEVVGLDRMYAFQLTAAELADMSLNSSLSGAPLKEGDYAALMAMHVTSREIDRWTWQTFWWSPNPDVSPDGDFRPASVKREFRNYNMCTAWSMNGPPESETGTPDVCFNPWLETGLEGIDGVRSNCMTCHRMAAWPGRSTEYLANGFVSPSDPIFANSVKLDFLWSVTRAQ
jgi:hypothetical protein